MVTITGMWPQLVVGKIIWIQGLLLGLKAAMTFCGELHGMARTLTAS